MKNIILLFVLLLGSTLYSQIINLEDKDGTRTQGAYYKDVNNVLNQFEGKYRYTNNTDTLVIVLKKFVNCQNPEYSQDFLAGEIKYVKNGVLKFDNLAKINDNLPNKLLHHIAGNSIINNLNAPLCDDCYPNQKRAKLAFFASDNLHGGHIVIQKESISGQPERIKIYIHYANRLKEVGQPDPPYPIIPGGDYILTKID